MSSSVSGSSSATSLDVLLAQKMLLANLIFPNDIGSLLKPSMSTTDIVCIVNSLNQEQKYKMLKCHFVV